MKRIKLEIAYDGTNYQGWQTQTNSITIEKVINENLSKLLKEEIKIIGASRTDSGVHALGNVAVFDTATRIPAEKISYALNQRLPEDIKIQSSCEVGSDFHPRHCVSIKTYQYTILNNPFSIPTVRLYSYFIYKELNIEQMRKAATYLIGEHDFAAFRSLGSYTKTTIRTIRQIEIKKEDKLIVITISGNGFLYNMVRIIVGTLIQFGSGLFLPEYMEQILKSKDRTKAGPTALAKGLTLVKIDYKE